MDTTFIEELASAAPTPGGGGASAYVGALAAAAASMVGNLTVGKKTYADVEDEVRASLARLSGLRERLLHLVDEDAHAFEPLSATYRMPKNTPDELAARNEAMQAALVEASDVPLAIMRTIATVMDEVEFLAHHGSKLAAPTRASPQRSPVRPPTEPASTSTSTRPRWTTPHVPHTIAKKPTRWPRARACAATRCSSS